MKFVIRHEIKGRIRVHMMQKRMSLREADILQYYISIQNGIIGVKVYEMTADAVIYYDTDRESVLQLLKRFTYEQAEVPESYLQNSGRLLNAYYREKMLEKMFWWIGRKLFLPSDIRGCITAVKSLKYLWSGAQTLAAGKIEVAVLDAVSIGISVCRGDMNTASSIMLLLGIGEILEEWTHKKSVDDLARSMSLNVQKVWKLIDEREVLVSVSEIDEGDLVMIHMGNVIPFDGVVISGEAMVNQASLTGEPLPVRKTEGGYTYAGCVLEEGELIIQVKKAGGLSRFEKIVAMIEESEKLKSSLEGKAAHLADRVVPYTLAGAAFTWLFSKNTTKALSVLMVDFSCALKLAMPISVLSAIREASQYKITVKGGKFLEAMSEADTIVFDKTGTLTKAKPIVVDVIPFGKESADEMLRIAACLEEHFPHSMARAIVEEAKLRGLIHEEMHSKVNYIVAHGISSTIEGKKAVVGSYHFVFEDEGCSIPDGMQCVFNRIPPQYSQLYLAIENKLAAVICIEDPVREEAAETIALLRKAGIRKIVMMTGDSERTAHSIAERVSVDEYFSEVLPEDKARYVEREKQDGKTVIMIGDGINDSPALSAADVGIAVNDGAEIAREIADVTIGAEDLYQIVTLKAISDKLMKRIQKNYQVIVGFNTALIFGGIAGILSPSMSALLHNSSTLAISLASMRDLLNKEKDE